MQLFLKSQIEQINKCRFLMQNFDAKFKIKFASINIDFIEILLCLHVNVIFSIKLTPKPRHNFNLAL